MEANQPSPDAIKPPRCDLAMLHAQPLLLNDEQIAMFIVNGYIKLDSGLPAKFHKDMYDYAETFKIARSTNPGNNILPMLPALQSVFESPSVRGALASLLGQNYATHPHRHPHMNPPGFKEQTWHKDSYWGHQAYRHHVPMWIMAMYYPQDTPVELGPTAVAVRSQYFATPDDTSKGFRQAKMEPAWNVEEKKLACEAGTVVLIHYDIWHKGTGNISKVNRYMYKFQFMRMEPPTQPTWASSLNVDWPISHGHELISLYKSVWAWMSGKTRTSAGAKVDPAGYDALFLDFSWGEEPRRVAASYSLLDVHNGVGHLLDQLYATSSANMRRGILYALSRTDSEDVANQLCAFLKSSKDARVRAEIVAALGGMGKLAISALDDMMQLPRTRSQSPADILLCQYAAEAIGLVLYWPASQKLVSAAQINECVIVLASFLNHHVNQVRFNACLTIARIAAIPAMADLLPVLEECIMNDSDRYVRAYALEAISRMETPEARRITLRVLKASSWCPITTSSSPF